MTTRIKGLTVTLQENLRDEDAQCIADAIKLLNGVIAVEMHAADLEHNFAVNQAKHELRSKLWEIIR